MAPQNLQKHTALCIGVRLLALDLDKSVSVCGLWVKNLNQLLKVSMHFKQGGMANLYILSIVNGSLPV